MCKVIFILNCAILVTSNPLQALQSCPLTNQNSYGQQDRPHTIPLNNFSPYQEQYIVPNQITPSYQTIPYLYNDQSNQLYFVKSTSNPNFSSFVNPIISVYDRNGIEIKRYIANPTGTLPNVVNNYIIVPSEFLNQSNVNKKETSNLTWKNIDKSLMETSNSEQLNQPNIKATSHKSSKNTASDNITNKNKISVNKADKTKSKKNTKREDEANTKQKSSENEYRKLKSDKIENVEKQDRRNKKRSKVKIADGTNNKSLEHSNIRKHSRDNNSKKTETENKKPDRKNKAKPNKKKAKNDMAWQEDVNLNVKPKESNKNTADVEVCFDINEDCTNLENRRTRNNKYDYRTNNQQKLPKEFSDYFAPYMNNAMYNQQLNPNFYNTIANFPFNFDYIYQILQQSNAKPNVSSKRRKNKRKKPKSKKENKKANKNKNQDTQKASSDCEKVIELTPQYMEIEQTTELINNKETSFNEDVTDKAEDKIKKDIEANLIPKLLTDINEPVTNTGDNSKKVTVQNVVVEEQEDYIPFVNENCITDDYYPDFTSDNNYLSKEEFEINNFHDRYYYTSDKEMSREKRKYGGSNAKLRHFNNNDVKTGKGNTLRKKDDSKELNFRTPPALEFPDFKTEMIDKDRYLDYENDYSNNKERQNVKSYSDIEEFNLDFNNNRDNEVETIFAHSKVAKYGAPSNKEEIVINSPETNKQVKKNLLSTDGMTTIILARSLGLNDY